MIERTQSGPGTMSLGLVVVAFAMLAACKEEGPIRYSAEQDGREVAAPERAPMERCYGIARAGRTDGLSGSDRKGADGPGTSRVDWQGNGWRYVKRGTCAHYGTPGGPVLPGDRRGSLMPLDRDMPDDD